MQKTTDKKVDVWDGNQYNKNSSVQFDAAIEFLHTLSLYGNEQILDVGCGDGKITLELANLVPNGNVIGIDFSPSMLEIAKKNYQRKNLHFQLQDAQQLNFTQQFDVVTSFFCLQWVPNKLAAFQGIYNSLKSQGRLLAIFPTVNYLCEITNNITTNSEWKEYFINYPDPFIPPRDTRYDEYATQAGLKISAYQREPLIAHFSIETLCGWLFAVTPHLTRLPNDEEKNNYIRTAVDIYLQKNPPAKDGLCKVEFTIIKLIADK